MKKYHKICCFFSLFLELAEASCHEGEGGCTDRWWDGVCRGCSAPGHVR